MSHYQECLLCGVSGPQVVIRLAEFKEGKRFDAIPRCSDETGCRSRVELQGEDWPLVEGRTAA